VWSIKQKNDWTTGYRGTFNSSVLQEIFGNKFPLHFEDVPLATRRQIRVQHDAQLSYFVRGVMEFLNKDYE
jgi:hypothetical protein